MTLAALVVICAGSVVPAQKIFNAEELDVAMKVVGSYFEGVGSAVAAGDYDDAKAKLVVVREYLDRSWTFWNMNERADVANLVRSSVSRLDDLDNVLSEVAVNPNAVAAAMTQATAACGACHFENLWQDPTTNAYIIKPGVIVEDEDTVAQAIELDEAELLVYVGDYQLGPLAVRVSLDDGELTMETSRFGRPPSRLLAQGDHVFVSIDNDEILLTFEVADRQAASFTLETQGLELQGSRVEP